MNLDKFKHKTFCDGRIIMINADCQEVMAEIEDKEIDLVLTDPPYGIDVCSMNMGGRKTVKPDGNIWDKTTPPQETFNQICKISKNQIIWGGNYFNLPPSRCFLIWDKGETMYGRDFAECEMAWSSFDKNAKIFKKNPNQLDRFHPTQKPIQLMAWCLNNHSKEDDLIFDAFAGSFTTAIACIRTKRRFIGVELDPIYFEKAVERVETELKQGVLF